ncbi:MAG: hypothetical protein JW828_12945 [Sedimentisphaerales bacterium]|nr:hypothetical protein [Sedimentisphaerales bacterium]
MDSPDPSRVGESRLDGTKDLARKASGPVHPDVAESPVEDFVLDPGPAMHGFDTQTVVRGCPVRKDVASIGQAPVDGIFDVSGQNYLGDLAGLALPGDL